MTQLLNWPAGRQCAVSNIVQGEFSVSEDPGLVFSTLLGSCVAVCLYEEKIGVGGMNHYLLPDSVGSKQGELKYGAHSMELLINGLLRRGADRRRLQAKIFGGARMNGTFQDIGTRNVDFAVTYLERESIPVISSDLRGKQARRIHFHPTTGSVRCLAIQDSAPIEIPVAKPVMPPAVGDITLF
jgi:chemotaxis protein CheD